jgi:mono/diheme cytochrome c family protein
MTKLNDTPWALVVGALMLIGSAGGATAQNDTSAGLQVWSSSGCGNCHGARGEGGSSHDFPDGPSLRTTIFEGEALVDAIRCGLPGTPMPAWQLGAYTAVECYGMIGEVPEGTVVTNTLTAEQIDDLVEFIEQRIKAK